jgi:hypothetical protein
MMGVKYHNSCRDLFKILTIPHEYIFSLINFIINQEQHFKTTADDHSVNIRHKHHLNKQTANLLCFQESAYYAGIRSFSNLPSDPKSHMNEKA